MAIYQSVRRSSQVNEAKEKIRGIRTGKEEVKLYLFFYDMILCKENSKESTKKPTRANK